MPLSDERIRAEADAPYEAASDHDVSHLHGVIAPVTQIAPPHSLSPNSNPSSVTVTVPASGVASASDGTRLTVKMPPVVGGTAPPSFCVASGAAWPPFAMSPSMALSGSRPFVPSSTVPPSADRGCRSSLPRIALQPRGARAIAVAMSVGRRGWGSDLRTRKLAISGCSLTTSPALASLRA